MKTLTDKNFNFLEAYNRKPKLTSAERSKRRWVAPLVIIALVFVAAAGYFVYSMSEIKADIAVERQYLDNPETIKEYNDAVENSNKAAELSSYCTSLETSYEAIKTSPVTDDSLFKLVSNCAADKVAVKGYSYSFMTGVLIIDITTDGVTEVPDFVARLRATNRFDDIVYQGYRSADGASYGFFVECVLPIGYVSEGGAE